MTVILFCVCRRV